MPNSPDAAPCHYFLWGYLKNRLKHHKVKSTVLMDLKML